MNNMNRMYNIVAQLCSYFINTCNEDFFVHYSCVSKTELNRSFTILEKDLPSLYEGRETHILKESEITDELLDAIENTFERLKQEKDYSCIMHLTMTLDEALSDILLEEGKKFQTADYTTVLNINRESTGVGLLPRYSCCWERKNRLAHRYNRMDNFLFNFLLMENTILDELIDIHHFLDPDFFPHFEKSKTLKVAATPLRREPDFDFVKCDDGKMNYYKVDYHEDTNDKNNNLIWQKILKAAENHCDIIVFPEGISNPETIKFVQYKITSLAEKEQATLPGLIILPSLCEERDNTATILNRKGEILFQQKKQNPVRMMLDGTPYLEKLNPSHVINILHYEGIGRIAILICKDFLTTKYLEQLMRCFKLTLIIVPSFSTGSYDFHQSSDICAHDDCNVVWINSCAAIAPGKESNFENIGYVRKRISRYDDESQSLRVMPTCPKAFDGTCDHSCIFFETMGM